MWEIYFDFMDWQTIITSITASSVVMAVIGYLLKTSFDKTLELKIEKLKEQAIITKERVAVLQNGINNAQMLFRNGMANYLEVITAQRNVLESELALALTQKELSEAVIGLYKSLGGGWRGNK